MTIARIEDAISAIASGKMVVVVDDQNRENEGDIVVAADAVTPETIAFMMNHARGLVCIAMEGERLDALDIPLMVPNNTESHKTAFTVSVDYLKGTTTGISAADRAATVRALVDDRTKPDEFARPGHIFPLRANPRGVLGRPATPKPQSISPASPEGSPPASSAKSPTTTEPCPACPNSRSSPNATTSPRHHRGSGRLSRTPGGKRHTRSRLIDALVAAA